MVATSQEQTCSGLTYIPRLVKPFPAIEAGGRMLKVYGIFCEPEFESRFPSLESLRARVNAQPAERREDDHGLGFVVLHFGKDGNYLLLGEWYGGNMLRQRVYGCEVDAEGDAPFTPLDPGDLVACVWELEVMKFERDAWVRTVMARGVVDELGVEAYLGMKFSGWA